MKMRSMILLMAVVAMATIATATPIINGTLNCPGCVVPRPPGYVFTPNVSTGITGWTVGGLGVNYVGEWNGTNGWQSSDGLGSVIGLNVQDQILGTPDWGSVSQQVVGLTPLTTYTISFDMSAAPGGKVAGGGGTNNWGVKQMNVQVGALAQIFNYNYQATNSSGNMNWVTYNYTYTTLAAETTVPLTFQSSSTGSFFGPALDNVRVQEGTIPEPGTFSLLMGAALAGLAFVKFRK